MSHALFQSSANPCRVTGPAGTGKTEYLLGQAVSLIEAGASAERIALFAATPDACARMQNELAQRLNHHELPFVATPLEYELALLSLPEAIAATGRQPRIMLKYEENIFLEDMKTSGVQPRRLAEMIKFFYRSCADLETMDYQWFYSDEEESTFELLNTILDYYGCYTLPLVGAAAYQFVANNEAALAKAQFDYVLIDDYQLLSKASQCLLGKLAKRGLMVAGDPLARVSVSHDYPYPEGLHQFKEDNPDCTCIDLRKSYSSPSVTGLLNPLLADAAFGSAKPLSDAMVKTERVHSFSRPEQEFAGIAKLVASALEAGTPASLIAIACPRSSWGKSIAATLAQHHIACSRIQKTNVSGDVRSLATSFSGRIVSVLRLMANPQDHLALRCWCGFGDYLANSALFTDLCKAQVHLGLGTTSIQATTEESALFARQRDYVIRALDQLRNTIDAVAPKTGFALVEAIAEALDPSQQLPFALRQLTRSLEPNASAADIVDALDAAVLFPSFQEDGVRIGGLEDFVGQRPQLVILAGMVNGFTPPARYFDPTTVERDKRAPLLEAEAAKVYTAAGKAHEALHITYFTEALLTDSERLKLKVERVRLRKGERVCEIHPSETIRALTGVYFND